MKFVRIFPALLFLVIFALVGCGGKSTDDELKSEQELYDAAFNALNRGLYETAVENYQALERVYPYGEYSAQGQLEIAYAYYKMKESEQAEAAIDKFIQSYPEHPHIDYAYYLKGLIVLPIQAPKFLEALFVSQEEFSDHEIEAAYNAVTAFEEVVARFPFSVYADAARQNIIDLINVFARHDIKVGYYYLKRKAYVGAANRAKSVLETYNTSPHTEQALAILIYAYNKMDLPELEESSRTVLTYNFPDSRYLDIEVSDYLRCRCLFIR